jgi:hypothetical protein
VTVAPLQRRRLAGAGQTWPSGLEFEREKVREARLNMSNPHRVTAGLVRALCGKPTGDSGNRVPVVVAPAVGVATACGN